MADNLQDFLRKAAERRAKQQAAQSGQAPPPQQPPQTPPLQPPRPRQPDPIIEIYESEPVSPDDVVQHVEEHLDTSGFDRRASTLGSEIAEHSQDDRLHEVFDHSVGRLSKSSVTDDAYERKDKDVDYMVDETDYFEERKKKQRTDLIGAMFKSPQSVVQAFIFSEIIKPPTDRWE